MSVSGFILENSQFELSVSVSVRFGPPGIWSDRFAPSTVVDTFLTLRAGRPGKTSRDSCMWQLQSQWNLTNFSTRRREIWRTPRGPYSRKGVFPPSRCLLESPFLETLPRIPIRTLLPSEKPAARQLLRTLLRAFSKAISRPLLRSLLRRARCCTTPLLCALGNINKTKLQRVLNILGQKVHWEIKGWFRKRVVLANVPSFRFSFLGNIRRNHPFGNHPFVNTKKGHWEIKGRFLKGWFWRTYPRSGFRSGGTSAETTLLETTLLRTPETSIKINCKGSWIFWVRRWAKQHPRQGSFPASAAPNPDIFSGTDAAVTVRNCESGRLV